MGRREELARLRAVVTGSGTTGTIAVAISGEPGIGKTRLLGELVALAEEAGRLTLAGRAAQFERDIPFAVFIDALDGYLASQDSRRLDAVAPQHRSELARIFPSLGHLADGEGGAGPSERHRAHYAVSALLEHLAEPRPLLLSLDDLQWADDASLELAAHLLRRTPAGAQLLALAYRTGEATPTLLTDAVGSALREERIEILDLVPLSEDEAAAMLGEEADQATRSWLYRESGGNPFYLEQLQRSLAGSSRPGGSGVRMAPDPEVPRGVAAALEGELAALSRAARLLLEGASVAGDPFELELAAAAAQLQGEESRDALDELLAREMVHSTEAPRRFRFRHPIVHRTVYAAAGEGWRIGAHARARDYLEQLGAGATELAYHVEQAATAGDEAAIGDLERAAREASALAPGAAANWLGAALRLLPEDAVDRRLELLVALASALAGAGRLEESRATLLEALEIVPSEAEEHWVALVTALAEVNILLGLHEEARERLRSALAGISDPTSSAATGFQCALSLVAIYDAKWEEGRKWAELASQGIGSGDQPALLAMAEAVLSFAWQGLGQISEAERHRERAAALLESLDDLELGEALDAVFHLGLSEYCLERYEEGVRHLDRGVEVSQQTNQVRVLNTLKGCQAWCLVHLGRGREAVGLIEEAIDAARFERNPQSLAWLLGIGGWIACLLGDLDLAVHRGEEAVAIGSESDESGMSHTVRTFLGYAYAEAGEHERCLELMGLAGAPDLTAFFSAQKTRIYEAMSSAALGLGRNEEAEAFAARSEAFAESVGLPGAIAAARRARARLLMARDDHEQAAKLALAAVEGLEGQAARLEAARTGVLAGQALALAGQHEPAATRLERASAELDTCGADRWRDQAARELRLLGRTVPRVAPRSTAREGVEALSRREREIAALAAEAKTNREIAATLYISEKTVEKHLSKVFAKLGVSGRAAIGARLVASDSERY